MCENNNDKGHTRNIHIKYMIIIIVQYTITKMYISWFISTKIVTTLISITHLIDFDCIITNNPPCITYGNLIPQTKTGLFSK